MLFQFPMTAIREIKILNKLHHENVIKLKEIVTSPGTFFNDLNDTIVLTRFLHSFLNIFPF
jgi:serine/threonine protein kinase